MACGQGVRLRYVGRRFHRRHRDDRCHLRVVQFRLPPGRPVHQRAQQAAQVVISDPVGLVPPAVARDRADPARAASVVLDRVAVLAVLEDPEDLAVPEEAQEVDQVQVDARAGSVDHRVDQSDVVVVTKKNFSRSI